MKIKIGKNKYFQIGRKCVMKKVCPYYDKDGYCCNKNQLKIDGGIQCGILRSHYDS